MPINGENMEAAQRRGRFELVMQAFCGLEKSEAQLT